MILRKFQSWIIWATNLKAITLVQFMFIFIPILVIGFLYTFMAQGQMEMIFKDPVLTVQFILVLTYPFCYLIIKNIKENIKDKKQECLLPMWLLTIYQISSFNIVCAFLMLLSLYQIYQKKMFLLKEIKVSKYTKSLLIGLIPLGLLYALILFVKFRVGLL